MRQNNVNDTGSVRPGRECKICGENRRAEMSAAVDCIDGHRKMCKACSVRKTSGWRTSNPEVYAAQNARSTGSASHLAAQARYYARNRAAVIARSVARGKTPEENAAIIARRRSRLASAACAPAFDLSTIPFGCAHDGPFHLDHIVPVARGGCAHLHNLQFLCAPCNQAKAASLPPIGEGCPLFWEEHNVQQA